MSNTTTDDLEELEGGGSYVKWEDVGQMVEGNVVAFTLDGGRDFNGQPCPEITLSTADGIQKVTCGQANLKSKAQKNAAKFVAGAFCRVTFSGTYPSDKGQPGKEFRVGLRAPSPVPLDEI
jgi:hypothetical protein